jgi:hypothetical protein
MYTCCQIKENRKISAQLAVWCHAECRRSPADIPFITLKDFDHDCVPHIITSLLEGEACRYLTEFLRVLDPAYSQPMLDTALPDSMDALLMKPSTLYNYERSDEGAILFINHDSTITMEPYSI